MSNSNKARDKRRDISKAIRESQRSRMDALEAFAQGLTDLKAMRTEVKRLEARVDGELRANAKAAGNSVADIRNVERIVNELADKEEGSSEPSASDGPDTGSGDGEGSPSLDGGRVMAGRKAPRPLPRAGPLARDVPGPGVRGVPRHGRQPRVLEGDRRRVRRVIVDSGQIPEKEEDRQNRRLRRTEGRRHPHAGRLVPPAGPSPSSRNSRETSERCP